MSKKNSLFGNKKTKDLNSSTVSNATDKSSITAGPQTHTNSNSSHVQSPQLASLNVPSTNSNANNHHNHTSASSSNKTLDLIASKFFNLKTASSKTTTPTTTTPQSSTLSLKHDPHYNHEVASTCSSASLTNFNSTDSGFETTHVLSDNSSLKTNHSSNNLAGISSIQVPSSVLIFENRPRYLLY